MRVPACPKSCVRIYFVCVDSATITIVKLVGQMDEVSLVESQTLSCMEVWGGNQATFSAFEKAGLDIWLYSRPCGRHSNGGDVYYLSSCAFGTDYTDAAGGRGRAW